MNQLRSAHHLYTLVSSKYECNAPTPCIPQSQQRTMCKYAFVLLGDDIHVTTGRRSKGVVCVKQ